MSSDKMISEKANKKLNAKYGEFEDLLLSRNIEAVEKLKEIRELEKEYKEVGIFISPKTIDDLISKSEQKELLVRCFVKGVWDDSLAGSTVHGDTLHRNKMKFIRTIFSGFTLSPYILESVFSKLYEKSLYDTYLFAESIANDRVIRKKGAVIGKSRTEKYIPISKKIALEIIKYPRIYWNGDHVIEKNEVRTSLSIQELTVEIENSEHIYLFHYCYPVGASRIPRNAKLGNKIQ
jgi:SOS response regulatory protein OraA/RecX